MLPRTIQEGVFVALGAIRGSIVRSSLTILGVAIGVTVVVLMAAMINGIRSVIVDAIRAAGPDTFFVTRFDFTDVRLVSDGSGRPPWWNKPRITPEEAAAIAELPEVDEALFSFNLTVSVASSEARVDGVGASAISAGWPKYNLGTFLQGRDFVPAEVELGRPVVVLSKELAERLFGRLDPLGRHVRVRHRGEQERLTVIGVYEPDPNPFNQGEGNATFAIVPYTVGKRRLHGSDSQAQVLVVPADSVPQAVAMDRVIGALRGHRSLPPSEENNFAVLRSEQFIEFFDRITGVFFLVMLVLSSIGLLVGGVGVIGIMLISVTERTREIGVRKAVGATRREILWQFLVEAGVLTLLGGAIGMLAGWGAATVVSSKTPLPAEIPLWSAFAALGMALVSGLVFGLLPAVKASRLDPIVALRYE